MPSGTMPPGGGGKPVGGGSGGAASGRGDPSGSPFTGAGLRNPTGPMGSRQREGLPGFGNYPSAGPIANGASGGLTGPEGRDGNGGGRVISPPGTTGFRASTNSGGSGSGSEQALPGSSTSGGGSVAPGSLDPGRPGNGSDGPASGPGVNNGPSGGSGPPSLESPSTSIATAPSSPLPAGAAGPGNPAPPSGIANKSDGSKGSGGDGGDKAASPLGPSQVPYPGAVPPPPGAKPGSSQPANPNQNGGGSDVYSEGARSMPKGPNSPAPGGEVDSARSGMEVPGPSGLPNLPGGKRTTTPPSRPPVRLSGSRDWALSVECTADAVVLPTGERITAKALAAPEGGKELRSAVEALISRKQATVREGEPPYRPLIRFLVHPDGLRLYHMAYPTLEPLQVPIVRQNVEADDHRPGEGGR